MASDSEPQDCDQLRQSVEEYERSGKKDDNRERYLINRSVELGCTEHIPDEWGLQ